MVLLAVAVSSLAGLVYSAALNARQHRQLAANPTCERVDGSRCVITPNEVRQKVMGNLSERAAGNLSEEIDLLGPVRLRDVEEARDNVVKVIRALEEAGQIVVSRSADEFVE